MEELRAGVVVLAGALCGDGIVELRRGPANSPALIPPARSPPPSSAHSPTAIKLPSLSTSAPVLDSTTCCPHDLGIPKKIDCARAARPQQETQVSSRNACPGHPSLNQLVQIITFPCHPTVRYHAP